MADTVAAIVVAAGRGSRAGAEFPKQYRMIAGAPLIRASLAMLGRHAKVDLVQPVIHADDRGRYASACADLTLLAPVVGGASRQASVRAGLEALQSYRPDIVLVHDAARPFASAALVASAIDNAKAHGAAVPALPLADTVKQVDAAGHIVATLERGTLRIVQTPQAFNYDALLDAHRRAATAGRDEFPDDAALCEWAGLTVTLFAGEAGNVKLTTADDFARAEALRFSALADLRTGNGFDVHAFGPGDHVTLGGVRIAHERALIGHSDADVVLHALTDAVLGALAEGDIGSHFPPGDARWRGASSHQFLAFAAERVRARGGLIAHLDVTLVCEAPRIAAHREAMRARIAEIAGIPVARVALKATTSEGLGFTGRGEGIAAFATATIRLPWSTT